MNGIILITIDALRYDHISFTGHRSETTPFIDSLAEKGIFFHRHYSSGSGTSTSFPGIHASALPLDYGYSGLEPEHQALAEALESSSVQTLGVTAVTSCSSLFDYNRGFDTFQDWVSEDGLDDNASIISKARTTIKNGVKRTPGLNQVGRSVLNAYRRFFSQSCPYHRATEVTDTSLSLLSDEIDPDEPYFIWIHYVEPHAPYFPPDQYVDQFYDGNMTNDAVNRAFQRIYRSAPEVADGTMIESATSAEVEAIRGFYAAATRYVDKEVRRLVLGLEELNLLDDAAILLTADHGEELFDHGDIDHRPKMYEELIHVPLIYYDGDSTSDTESVSQITSHLDLAPTIAEFFDAEIPDQWRGNALNGYLNKTDSEAKRERCLVELCHRRGLGGAVQPEYYVGAVCTKTWKFIYNRQLGTHELYDLQSDPKEQDDLTADRPDKRSELESIVESRLSSVTESEGAVDLSDAAKEQLEQLGYLEN